MLCRWSLKLQRDRQAHNRFRGEDGTAGDNNKKRPGKKSKVGRERERERSVDDAVQRAAAAGRMDRADQSVTRHAAASRAAYETLYAAFAAQPGGIRDSHRGVLEALRAELRLDQAFADGVTARHDSKRQRSLRASGGGGGGQGGEEKSGGGDGGDAPGIQIEWKEVRAREREIRS